MNNTRINKISSATLVLIMCYGASFTHAATNENISNIYSSQFDSCFSEGYNVDELTQDQTYITAQCFTSLLEKEGADTASLGASKLTIMQYSDSWYKAAIEKGHKLAQDNLDEITVVPNPYVTSSMYNESATSKQINFMHLPDECTISIYTITGEFVDEIQHGPGSIKSSSTWDLRNAYGKLVAPGLYVYKVETLTGLTKVNKFAIIR